MRIKADYCARSHMDMISKIVIKHFRSINEIEIADLSHINVFSGLNDVGKSNVIKALNVFFTNDVDRHSPFDFQRDTNSWHSHYSSSGHNKKEVSIRFTFRRPKRRYESSLSEEFWIEKYWDIINQPQPKTTWGDANGTKSWEERPRALTEFMNRSHFFYIPAVRDRDYLRYLLSQYSKTITDRPSAELQSANAELSRVVSKESASLRKSLFDLTGLQFSLQLPESLLTLLEAAGLYTEGNKSLQLRGDGIQALAVAGILAYLTSEKKNDFYYWGFEEPENSLEYIKSTELATKIETIYSRQAQIFLSTHSPAFLSMESRKTSTYRLSLRREREYQGHTEDVTSVEPVFLGAHEDHTKRIANELGFFELVKKIDREYRDYEKDRKVLYDNLTKLEKATMPLLIVEGIHDVNALKYAWKRLYKGPMPFTIFDGEGETRAGDLVEELYRVADGRKIGALFDHDLAGIGRFRKLCRKIHAQELAENDLSFVSKDLMVLVLPPPSFPDRKEQALNKNLSMEFYFSDDFLMCIDKRTGHQLFRTDKLIYDGKHVELDEDTIKDLFDSGRKSMIHRALNNDESAKRKVIDALVELEDEDFLPFHHMFEIIMGHLQPGVDLQLKPSLNSALSE